MDLEKKVKKFHQTANLLLVESKLEQILEKHGRVVFTGSYAYNLILSPDIDLYLIVKENTHKSAVKLLNDLIKQGWWQNYEFGNFVEKKFRTLELKWLPRGYYLQGKNYFGERWKVDIWMVDEKEYKKRCWNDRLTNLTPEQRAKILKLKDARIKGKIDKTVHEIYESVLYKERKSIQKTKLVEAKLYTDGGSRGNPGHSAGAYVICSLEDNVVEKSGFYIGVTTNNQAEYQALLQGLQRSKELGIKRLTVYLDSELVVKQLHGLYKVKHLELKPLFTQVKALAGQFEQISFLHVLRGLNQLADAELNRILDERELKNRS